MASFGDQLARFRIDTVEKIQATSTLAVFTAHASITKGSALTGAPGQPVQTGRLRNSWQITKIDKNAWRILTSMKYARSIEDGRSYAHGGKPITLRSQVGGFHSLKMTVANWDRIVEDSARRVAKSPKFNPQGAP